ncbi:hypothetical protein FLIKMFBD_01114 [Mannheimia haemolytica]
MKTLALLTALLGLVGCDLVQSKQAKNYIGNNLTEICIDNVVYLIYSGDKKGGIWDMAYLTHYELWFLLIHSQYLTEIRTYRFSSAHHEFRNYSYLELFYFLPFCEILES